MSVAHRTAGFLGEQLRGRLLALLDSPGLSWRRSEELGRTGRGHMLQLTSPRERERPAMVEVTLELAARLYDHLERTGGFELPRPEELDVQVFPVRMHGSRHDPPSQSPHRDSAAGQHPLLTAIYYPLVAGTVGGRLALHDDEGRVVEEVAPATDDLVVIHGRQLHSVTPLAAGSRVSVVTNLYR